MKAGSGSVMPSKNLWEISYLPLVSVLSFATNNMSYLISAIVMTLSVLKGHSPIACLSLCDISCLWHVCGLSASAELFIFHCMHLCGRA